MVIMTKDYVNDIKELNSEKVFIKDKVKVNNVIHELVKDGKKKLQVILDFDRTITKHHHYGERQLSSFGMFQKCASLPKTYIDSVTILNEKYFPIEYDPTVPHGEKLKHMEEWWKLSEQLVVGLKVPTHEIEEVVRKVKPMLRDGCHELFEDMYKAKIPVLVFSAGLGQTVLATLKENNILMPNVKVVANFLNYDEDGVIQGFRDRITIHVCNKNESVLKGTEYYKSLHDRTNAIVVGDSLGDAAMVNGVENAHAILKIGFLYENIEENLPVYMDAFDIVLVDDQTMHVLHAIFKCIKQ